MKLLKKVSRIEVKRCFVMTHYMKKFGVARKRDSKLPSRNQYLDAIKKSKKSVNSLNEKQLDKIIAGEYKKRLRAYNAVEWYRGEVSIKEVGVWKGAGGLPVSWTNGSLFDTAKRVKEGLNKNSKEIRKRAKKAIPSILEFANILKKEKYLSPIIFENGVGTNGRKRLAKQRGEIDDGCMRSIAFAISGDKKIKAYIGVALKK